MRAARCLEPGRFELREVPQPQPGAGEVLVRVHNCGICGSDLHYYHGGFPVPAVCPGHEISGEIAEVGSGVAHLHPGDRIAVEPLITCGHCPACRRGDYQICREFRVLGTQADGGFADYVRVPASAAFPLPAGLPWAVGALSEPAAVCVHAVRLAGVRLGQRVLVLGGGSIGLLAALVARAAGAGEVLITARHAHQKEAAARLGARPFGDDRDGELSAYGSDHPIDVVIETVGGSADTLSQALYYVRSGGVVSVLGVFTGAVSINPLLLVLKEARLIGSLTYGRAGATSDFEVAIDLLDKNRQLVAPLITHRFPLDQIDEAFAAAADKRRGSIKVTMQS